MNDEELIHQLRSITPPAPDTAARERARLRALAALGEKERGRSTNFQGLWWLRAATGLAAVLMVAAIFWWRTQPRPAANPAALLSQVEAAFPGELNAVVERNGHYEVTLADAPSSPSDQPLLVEFRRSDAVVRVWSYSGRHVCVDIAGTKTCFEGLLDGSGGVIVEGEDFVCSSQRPASTHGWMISAHTLQPST